MNFEITKTLFQRILFSVDSTDAVISKTWLDTVLEIMKYVPKEILQTEVVPFAIAKSNLSKTVEERVISCQLLGGLIAELDSTIVKRDIIPVVHSLCQDVDGQVRTTICRQLPIIYSVMGREAYDLGLLPSLIEFTNDDDVKVSSESFETVLNLIPTLSQDAVVTIVLPLLRNFFKRCSTDCRHLLLIVTKNIGKLFTSLEGVFSAADKKWFLSQFVELSRLSLSTSSEKDISDKNQENDLVDVQEILLDCRQYCAENFPTIVRSCLDDADSEITCALLSVLNSLSSDSWFNVRKTIASNFFAVADIFQRLDTSVLDIYLRLLGDLEDEVRFASITNLADIISIYHKMGIIRRETLNNTTVHTVEILMNLIDTTAPIRKWRITVSLMEQFQQIIKYFPPEFLYGCAIGILFKHLKSSRQVPCRLALATTLLVVMKENPNVKSRDSIQKQIVEDDAVLNIRISLCLVIPELIKLLKSENDIKTLNIVERIIFALENERDKSISEQVRIMKKKLSDLSSEKHEFIENNPMVPNHHGETESCFLDINANIESGVKKNESCIGNDNDVHIVNITDFAEKKIDIATFLDDSKTNTWTEKEFLIDTGVAMKSTVSRIPSLNPRVSVSILKRPKTNTIEQVHNSNLKANTQSTNEKVAACGVMSTDSNFTENQDLIACVGVETEFAKSVADNSELCKESVNNDQKESTEISYNARRGFINLKPNEQVIRNIRSAKNATISSRVKFNERAGFNANIRSRFQNCNQVPTNFNYGYNSTQNLCLSLQYMRIFQHRNPTQLHSRPPSSSTAFENYNKSFYGNCKKSQNNRRNVNHNSVPGRPQSCILYRNVNPELQVPQHSSSDDMYNIGKFKPASRLPVRRIQK